MTIDVHAHIVDRQWVDELTSLLGLTVQRTADGKVLLRHRGYTVTWVREDMFDVDARLRAMDAKRIERRVLSLTTPNVYAWPPDVQVDIARRLNDALHRLCKKHPDRFSGFASLPLKCPEAAAVELDRSIDDLEMVGVSVGSNVDGMQLDHPSLEPIWAKIDGLRLPVFEHPVFPASDAGFEGFELPLRLGLVFDTTLSATRLIYSGVFERYPHFPYIMAHSGGALLLLMERLDNGYRLFPDCRAHITKLPSEYIKRFYYDTTAFGQNELEFVARSVGCSQILFGTDDPYIDADTSHVQRLSISTEEKLGILGTNAMQILGLTSRD